MKLDKVERQYGDHLLPSPDDDPTKWLRFDCPSCSGKSKKTAAVNYDADFAICFRCTALDGQGQTVLMYRKQISRQVTSIKNKFGPWFTYDEIYARANELVWHYSEGMPGSSNDGGRLDHWITQASGNNDQVERYVSRALKGDLLNWADTEVSKRRHDTSLNQMLEKPPGKPGEALTEKQRDSYFQVTHSVDLAELILWYAAEEDAVPYSDSGCNKTRNGLGPYKGHCLHCDAKLRPRVDAWIRRYRQRQIILADDLKDGYAVDYDDLDESFLTA